MVPLPHGLSPPAVFREALWPACGLAELRAGSPAPTCALPACHLWLGRRGPGRLPFKIIRRVRWLLRTSGEKVLPALHHLVPGASWLVPTSHRGPDTTDSPSSGLWLRLLEASLTDPVASPLGPACPTGPGPASNHGPSGVSVTQVLRKQPKEGRRKYRHSLSEPQSQREQFCLPEHGSSRDESPALKMKNR